MSDPTSPTPVTVELREGGRWYATVPGTDTRPADRSLSRLESAVRRLLAAGTGRAPADIRLTLTISTGTPTLDDQIAHVCTLRARAEEAAEQARQAAEAARTAATPLARTLVQRGVSVRDAGTLLGGYSGSAISTMANSSENG